jgi:hypothetical protein
MGRIRNTTLWLLVLVGYAVFLPALFLLPRQILFEVTDAVIVACAVGVCIGYAPETWRAMKLPPHDMTTAHYAVVAVFILCAGCSIVFGGQWVWRAFGKPAWIIDTPILAFSRWVVASGMIMAFATNWSVGGIITVGGYRRTAALVVGATIIAAIAVGFGLG